MIVNQLERVADLLLLLKSSSRPLTLKEISNCIPLYADFDSSISVCRRQFERDKAVLRQCGIDLLMDQVGGSEQYAYRIGPLTFNDEYFSLTDDEREALKLASVLVNKSFPKKDEDTSANDSSQSLLIALSAVASSPDLGIIHQALAEKRTITFDYLGVSRLVDPGYLKFKSGYWYLIAFDRTKSATRTFRLDRIDSTIDVDAAGSAINVAAIDSSLGRLDHPWESREDLTTQVKIKFDSIEKDRAIRELGRPDKVEEDVEGSVTLAIGVSNFSAFYSWLFDFGAHAKVVEPKSVIDGILEWLGGIASDEVEKVAN
ncbi:MAG: WYL domain-containing protein [Acidimicrobiales bacterium]|nr:WYL domain-containing protein [Acidimicrobiales bacterium]